MIASDEGGRFVEQYERALGQVAPLHLVNTSQVGAANEALTMQLLVHLPRRWQMDIETCSPCGAIGVVAGVTAFAAGTVPRGKRDRLVMEIQECVVPRLPLPIPASAELERADD